MFATKYSKWAFLLWLYEEGCFPLASGLIFLSSFDFIYFLGEGLTMGKLWRSCRGQRTTSRSPFHPFTMWIPETELRQSAPGKIL